ncbi:hypothetical protein N7532_004208 [Penicillium argentinense]|uniref:U4/U6 snRNA-associated-splicing factor PRP24 n=1 Tax=Penicillium argentinense TaxID=1131581 RepID=A0A9W9KEP7_9EURO|nr:uncharacterized protein N7532_004208 [Penicillium argentinense]KAJ5103679.1 hypothetical protein N7532_004208 [Penicillium argentinense]
MDINSLLSPDSNPKSGNSTPVPGPTSNNAPTSAAGPSPHKAINKTRSGPARKGKPSSPLAQQVYAPTGLPESSQPVASASPNMSGNGAAAATDLSTRQASTPGMDTLADLAAMQHHQPQRSNAPSMLRNTESYESQLSPSTIHPHVNPINHNTPTPRTSFDIAMSEGPRETARRDYGQTSLDSDAQRLATEVFNQIQENPHTYDAHVKFIGILHTGFVNHVYPPNQPDIHGDPRRYDLLKDLRTAREEMDKLFAMGEDLWAEWIQDESMLAHSVNERIAVMELCQRSVEEEFGSTKLWHIYGEWVLYLYTAACEHGAGQWTEEDRMIGREVFSWQSVLEVWQRAAEATRFRINNSHLVWDRFLDLLDQDIDRATPNSQEKMDKINRLRTLWDIRLQTPHATWDQSFQKFSGFISKHYGSSNYEEIMSDTVARAAEAKGFYSTREEFELRLSKAEESGDKALEWAVYSEYIDAEVSRKRGRRSGFHGFHFELVNAVFQRAVLRFPTDVSLWEDYVMFLIDESMHGHASTTTIATLDRGTRHCPWSGNLWSQYLLSSEREGQSFSTISGIKHKATSTGLLDAGGMEEVLKVHTTWCSYLRRRAFLSDSTDEDLDVAEVGIRSAIESVQELGEKKYGRSYQGDPFFRLERIYIRYLSESGSWDSARETFKGLVPRRGNSYEFWLTYYGWELISWSKFVQGEATVDAARRTPNPSYATAVLKQAIKREDLDWPEKIVQTYIAHCEDYEDSDELQLAVIGTRKAIRAVTARREREAREAAAAQQQQQQQQWEAAVEASSSEKRKREDEVDANGEPTSKKARGEEEVAEQETTPAGPSRDRENAIVVVKNLPKGATELQVRQFFRHYGTINSVKMLSTEDEHSQTVHIEFETKQDALGALARDKKIFDNNTIEVHLEASSTLFVTNFPPAADDEFIRNLFQPYGEIVDVRWPSLKFQTTRRFCYVQFVSSSAALRATELNEIVLEGNFKLVAKISDPAKKQSRSGPMEEGREIFCRNLDFKRNEKDIEELFLRFGTVENVHLPRGADNRPKGYCFVVFSSKEEAEAALAMDGETFGSRPLAVHKSTHAGAKRMTNTVISHVASARSPSVEPNGNSADGVQTVGDRHERTLALMNVPDTVNEARIRALVEPFGQLVKISLRPDHQGAIVEYVDVHGAGKAALALDGKEIVPGRPLHLGSVPELLALKPDRKTDRITSIKSEKPKISLQPAGPIKRPQQPGARGGRRGGLGVKRAAPPAPSSNSNDKMDTTPDEKGHDSGTSKKSNDDFRTMLQQKREG